MSCVTPAGINATRVSPGQVSCGTPTLMARQSSRNDAGLCVRRFFSATPRSTRPPSARPCGPSVDLVPDLAVVAGTSRWLIPGMCTASTAPAFFLARASSASLSAFSGATWVSRSPWTIKSGCFTLSERLGRIEGKQALEPRRVGLLAEVRRNSLPAAPADDRRLNLLLQLDLGLLVCLRHLERVEQMALLREDQIGAGLTGRRNRDDAVDLLVASSRNQRNRSAFAVATTTILRGSMSLRRAIHLTAETTSSA